MLKNVSQRQSFGLRLNGVQMEPKFLTINLIAIRAQTSAKKEDLKYAAQALERMDRQASQKFNAALPKIAKEI